MIYAIHVHIAGDIYIYQTKNLQCIYLLVIISFSGYQYYLSVNALLIELTWCTGIMSIQNFYGIS